MLKDNLKKSLIVFNFEFKTAIKEKGLWIACLVISLLITAGIAAPGIISLVKNFTKDSSADVEKSSDKMAFCIMDDDSAIEGAEVSFMDKLENFTGNQNVGINLSGKQSALDFNSEMDKAKTKMDYEKYLQDTYKIKSQGFVKEELMQLSPFANAVEVKDPAELQKAIEQGDYNMGTIITKNGSVVYLINDKNQKKIHSRDITNALNEYQRNKLFRTHNVNTELVHAVDSYKVPVYTKNFGKDPFSGMMMGFFSMILVYFMVLTFGMSVATSVAREKNDRTMELLITNTNTSSLINGKVTATIAISLIQLLIYMLVVIVGFNIFRSYYPPKIGAIILSSLKPDVLLLFFVYTILGEILYFYLYAAIGALVSRVEEANQAATPVVLLMIGSYMLTSVTMNNPHSALMRGLSLFPFSSMVAMVPRYTQSAIPIVDFVISLVLLLAFTAFFAFISIKIYRMGSLNYGNRLGFFKSVLAVFKRER